MDEDLARGLPMIYAEFDREFYSEEDENQLQKDWRRNHAESDGQVTAQRL